MTTLYRVSLLARGPVEQDDMRRSLPRSGSVLQQVEHLPLGGAHLHTGLYHTMVIPTRERPLVAFDSHGHRDAHAPVPDTDYQRITLDATINAEMGMVRAIRSTCHMCNTTLTRSEVPIGFGVAPVECQCGPASRYTIWFRADMQEEVVPESQHLSIPLLVRTRIPVGRVPRRILV